MPSRPLILIIDDVPENVEVLGETLSDFCDIGFALSGEDGLAQIQETLPDLILLDVMMPGLDGYQVIDILKRETRTRGVPVIFVTAKNDAESETRALAAGAVDFIHKPINREVARARVQVQLALQAKQRECHQLNVELEQRVAERTQALRDALLRMEGAQQAKATFLANMSHELRTPLNGILGMAYLVDRQLTDPKARERVAKIQSSGQNLLNLINSILDMAKLEAKQFQIASIDFSLHSLLDASLGLLEPRAHAKDLAIVRDIDPALPQSLQGDPLRLGQILTNFVANAVKFSDRGTITLRMRQVRADSKSVTVRFEVEDQGIGIAPEKQATIFDAFEQADNSTTRQFGGAGLGLAICKHLALLMDGTVGVKSSLGQGSTFWLEIILALATQPAVASSEIDWNQVRQIVSHLAAMLSEDDITAQLLWQSSSSLLNPVLGERLTVFRDAMEAFDFEAAGRILAASIESCPSLKDCSDQKPAA